MSKGILLIFKTGVHGKMAERDLLSLYLKDIRQYKTLEKEEELELVIKAQSGDEEAKTS